MRNDDAEAPCLSSSARFVGLKGAMGRLVDFHAACHLVWQARKGNKDVLSEAQTELSNALALRPGWWCIPLLRAEIAELEGNEDLAIENYLRARELGDRTTALRIDWCGCSTSTNAMPTPKRSSASYPSRNRCRRI